MLKSKMDKYKPLVIALMLWVVCFSYRGFSQNRELDSLKAVLSNSKEDTTKVLTYLKLTIHTDSISYAQDGLLLAEQLHFKRGKTGLLTIIGWHYYKNEKYDIALDYLVKAMKIAEAEGFRRELINIYKFIGFIYRLNEPNTAIEYYEKGLSICNELKLELPSSYMLSAIGNVYEGIYNTQSKDGHNALEFYLKSLKIRERIGSDGEIASSYNETSRVYEKMGNFDEATELRKKGLALAEKSGSKENIIYLCNLIGQDFCRKRDFKKALEYEQKSYETIISEKKENYTLLSEVSKGLALTYSELHEFEKADRFYRLFLSCNDSISARTNNVNLSNLKQTLVHEKEVEHLLLKDLEIEKQKAIVEKQIVLRNAFLIGLSLVIILAFFILKGYRQKQKAHHKLELTNQKIEQAYKIIEEKTKAMTDSIRYALRIQRATLPHRSDIWASLKNSFVLYLPKDIVSGDFYWFKESYGKVLLAAVDCTGHGVPGAFMSIIGSERLNDAVQIESEPGKILSLLNKGIKSSLRQSEHPESTRDGMDIAFISIDLKSRLIHFSGANRPLWIVRKNATQIDEIKAEKLSIGGLTDSEQEFKTHRIQLSEGDSIYLFTDGFADQFGGEKSKKLTTKKFKEILLSLQEKTMREQQKSLTEFIQQWRGNLEQVDDILIIGIQL